MRKLERELENGPAVQQLESRLTSAGVLLDDATRSKVAAMWLWFLPVLGLGILRIVAGIQNGRPVAFIVVAVIAVAFVTLWVAGNRPRATARGEEMLAAERAGRKRLGHTPSGAELPMALALFGVGALWAADPALASSMSIARDRAWSGGGSGGGVRQLRRRWRRRVRRRRRLRWRGCGG